MIDKNLEKNEILKDLSEAFHSVLAPPNDKLLIYTSHGWDDVRDFVNPTWKAWDRVPYETIRSNFDVLPFFGPDALQFYLPAFIRYSLVNDDFTVAEFTRYALPPGAPSTAMHKAEPFDYNDYKFSRFSIEQKRVAQRFSDYYDRYWSNESIP